jgi:hypothetical protein
MQRDERPGGDEPIDDIPSDPAREQLRTRDDAILSSSERCEHSRHLDFVALLKS